MHVDEDIDKAKELSRLIFNKTTLEIIHLATVENLYPNEIARKLKKSSSLVVKRLKELEKFGIVKGYFTTQNEKAVKKYVLADEELFFRINLGDGETWIQKKKNSPISKIIKEHPNLFEGFENYLLWSKETFSSDELQAMTGLSLEESEEMLRQIKDDLENVFLTAYMQRLQGWKENLTTTYLEFIDDYLIIPTNRLRKMIGTDEELAEKLLAGETQLSILRGEIKAPELESRLKNLEKMKMVVLEKKHFPRIALDKVVELAKSMEDDSSNDVEKALYLMGGETGRNLKRFLSDPESYKEALEILFGVVKVEDRGNRIVLENCRVCNGLEESRACKFVSGLIESVLEGYGNRADVKKLKRSKNEMSCSFSLTPVENSYR